MEHDVTQFWADIKKYEDALAKDPASYSFVPLAELYRKSGLLDDAILVAKRGCETHPDYVGGFMALGRAYFDKGLKEDCRTALEKVIAFTPDNLLARRLLGQIYADAGETAAAGEALRYILSQNPSDAECQALLDSLHVPGHPDEAGRTDALPGDAAMEEPGTSDELFYEFSPDDEEIIEDAELLEELTDEVPLDEDEVQPSPTPMEIDMPLFRETAEESGQEEVAEESDPLITVTMAELYASQGFLKRALTIYRGLLESDPENADWNNRLYELKMAIDEDTENARQIATAGASDENDSEGPDVPGSVVPAVEIASAAAADRAVLETLEKWLATIRRIN